jgi:hypothetical protein
MPPGPVVAAARHSTILDATITDAFDYVADARHQREWNRAVKSFEQTTPGAIGVATRFIGQAQLVGRVSVEIVGYDRPHLIVHRARPGMAEVGHVWQFHPAAGGTRLDQCAVMSPRRWGWLLAPLMPLIVRLNTGDCGVSLRRVFQGKRQSTKTGVGMTGRLTCTVQRAPDDVFDFLADIRNERAWNPRVIRLDKTSGANRFRNTLPRNLQGPRSARHRTT